MAFLGHLLVRLLMVPLGAADGDLRRTVISLVANWTRFVALIGSSPESFLLADFGIAALMAVVFSLSTVQMLLPAAVGIVIAEGFTIRSWIFHALNGAVSMWVGWRLVGAARETEFYEDPVIVLAVGLAAGFIYWAIAGNSSGLFKPEAGPPATLR